MRRCVGRGRGGCGGTEIRSMNERWDGRVGSKRINGAEMLGDMCMFGKTWIGGHG